MKRFDWKYVPIAVIFILSMALAPVFRAQEQGSITRVIPVPDGAEFTVDGQTYVHAMSAAWPAGTKHTLWVPNEVQSGTLSTRFQFRTWEFAGGALQTNPVTITASPAISEFRAVFDAQYGLGVAFSNCPDPTHCQSAGKVYVNGTPIDSTGEVYLAANSTAVLLAFPNPGYVFLGWQPGANQTIVGFQNTVSMTAPITVYPRFQVARKVNMSTDPPELQLLLDRSPVAMPATMEWAVESVHTVGANSPQKDRYGKWWSFQSWSDGGDINHAYKVPTSSIPAELSAKYVPAAGVSILTLPVGLKVKVDGQYNALNPYYFAWGIGETHHLEAPLQQTDDQGRVWQFASWSNGGKATQDVVVPEEAENGGSADHSDLRAVDQGHCEQFVERAERDGGWGGVHDPVPGVARSRRASAVDRPGDRTAGRWLAGGFRWLAGWRQRIRDCGGRHSGIGECELSHPESIERGQRSGGRCGLERSAGVG